MTDRPPFKYSRWCLLIGFPPTIATQAKAVEKGYHWITSPDPIDSRYRGRKWVQDDDFPACKEGIWERRIDTIGAGSRLVFEKS